MPIKYNNWKKSRPDCFVAEKLDWEEYKPKYETITEKKNETNQMPCTQSNNDKQ